MWTLDLTFTDLCFLSVGHCQGQLIYPIYLLIKHCCEIVWTCVLSALILIGTMTKTSYHLENCSGKFSIVV